MEKELQRYRRSLMLQNVTYLIAALMVAAVTVLGLTGSLQPAVENTRWADAWSGFISGASFAIFGYMVLGITLNLRAIFNEKRLKTLYVKEHDERTIQIASRAGHQSYWFETVGLALGVVVGGYFNVIVALTCLGCLVFICLVRLALKIYYCKKF